MAGCEVYALDGAFYVFSFGETSAGIGVAVGPFFKVSADASDELLGGIVLMAMASYRQGLPDPVDYRQVTQRLVDFVRVRSWGAFAKKAQCTLVEAAGDRVRVVPQKKDGEAFEPKLEAAQEALRDPSAIGRLVRDSLMMPESAGT